MWFKSAVKYVLFNRSRLLYLAGGIFIGSGSFAGIALRRNQESAQRPPVENNRIYQSQQAKKNTNTGFSGRIKRWRHGTWSWPFPHWKDETFEMLCNPHVILLGKDVTLVNLTPGQNNLVSTNGCIGTVIPLLGATITCQESSNKKTSLVIGVNTSRGEHEHIQCQSILQKNQLLKKLKPASTIDSTNSRRFVDVTLPSHWEHPVLEQRLVPLKAQSKEYKRIEQIALSQEYKHTQQGTSQAQQGPYVKGKIKVLGISRVQSPKLWEAYCMRRAIICSENDGDANEAMLWHGTQKTKLILKHGLDPRVCSLNGLFGGGVYFADKTTKSVRYALNKPGIGSRGKLMLCRVALGRQRVSVVPQQSIRRPPDPFPLFPSEIGYWWNDQKFHSMFAPGRTDTFLSALLMNEFIVYHTNQGVPEYVVDFQLA